MNHILNFLRPIIGFNYHHPKLIVGIAISLAVVASYFAVQLKVDTDIANLLPPDNPHVIALENLRKTIGGETEMDVAIGSPDFQANKRFAEDLIEASLKLYDTRSGDTFFSGVVYKRETEILKDYALYLATIEELDELIFYLEDKIEDAKLEANPFFIDFDDEENEDEEDVRMANFQETYDELIPSEYPVNADSTVLVLKFYPTGSKSNLSYLRRMFATYDSLVVALNPASYHPEMVVLSGGRLKRHLLEIESIMDDVYGSFLLGISGVLLLVMIYFFGKKYINYMRGDHAKRSKGIWAHIIRMPVSIMVIGIPLFLGLFYTFGITYWYLGGLNTMTSVLFVILFGLGIDYGLHFYARYLEKRSEGLQVLEALYFTYESTGSAILTSAFTTAVALFILVLADFRGFSEFGFISGTGILLSWFCMIYIMPALITLFEKWGLILSNPNQIIYSREELIHRYPFAKTMVSLGVIIFILVGVNAHNIEFEYDFGNLEPEYPEYRAFRNFTSGTGGSSRRNPAYIIANEHPDVVEILDSIRVIKDKNADNTTILDVEALQERFPTYREEEEEKLTRIRSIATLLKDPFIRDQDDENLSILRRASQTDKPLDIQELPSFIKDRFMTRDGELGKFVMIYPSVGLSDGRNSIAFKKEIGQISLKNGETYFAASTSIAAAEMLELMQRESPWMVAATFLMIFILVNIAFKSLRWSIISMLPLLVGLSWTFGVMLLFDIKFNFYNLVVLPAILGIGNDNGVHLAKRYLEEGRNSMWAVLKSTGQHVSIGSLTTMFGFIGLLFTNHPGLYTIGLLATIGIGMTLLSALTFLPALIQLLEDKNWIKFYGTELPPR